MLKQVGAPDDATLDSDAAELYRALTDLIRVYQFRDRDRICCHDVSVTQCHALEVAVERGALTLNELAAGLYLDKSTASRVVDALERKGYLERRRHPDDGRALLLEATPAGRRLCLRIQRELIAEEKRILEDFDPAIRRALPVLIGRLARAAAARLDATGA